MPDPTSWNLAWPLVLAVLAFGYLLGSIPFGLIITRLGGMGDVREIGSGNIGATNVLRTGNKKLAAATLVCDALKGAIAVLVIKHFFGVELALIAGFAAFLGHLFPVWLKFKGGKGVATYIGVLLGLNWPFALLFCAVWLACAFLFRYSSLSAFVASLLTPLALFAAGYVQMAAMFAILTLILLLKHHENIKRLLNGEETKIGNKSKPVEAPPGSPT
ncbi:glycerol-3-phosphate 1-O-acyltransferase PlsY [Roseibium polysiphoniae]|uniref:Glycerol-3-phosphate acyltransferase n=1 Tax=Roseibium polysiphoniae TaxID=2571221 RepID=A0A944CBF1_9HYPH|nr:glycerol-3-phosphate 1-O-acyltransferase PlsY [Roseibium polysiphoniae]MBS8259918.1 glycerol-3-phosphate 1-O-acyltransferase PlsY [Roseibium polysiphoniae]